MRTKKYWLTQVVLSTALLPILISCNHDDKPSGIRVTDTVYLEKSNSAPSSHSTMMRLDSPIFSNAENNVRGEALEDTIASAIKNAKRTIRIEMFDLNDRAICNALKNSHASIFIILNRRNWKKTTRGPLRGRGNVNLAIGKTPGYYHDKILIVDSSSVYIGSYNYTEGATTRNTELIQPLHNALIAHLYSNHFWQEYEKADKKPLRKSK